MYSPKIREDLIPKLYEAAKKRQMPMTKLADELIADGLRRMEPQTLIDRSLEKFEVPQY
jgi:hypothetical protein